ncbi:DMT family transporter [Fulvimarina sp. 2208YS6-2-32]|uniref:DMT family transporter n=1 Tax=Fulvimarina uroteuthidis TaxID=3098149 RepID=A0ABU5I323_9HYPH|nr:DMT family transporter [Fulvimarina sp. 2208YS6-2-32]MDY8109753.1 DMT family transporter [Fulvimarina sp. 2208YS6-2-32]
MMAFGIFLFMANDALGKFLVETYSVGQVLFMRSAAALVILIPLVQRVGFRALIEVERPGQQVLRSFFATAEVTAFYAAIVYLPLAATLSFWLAAPIFVAALAPVFLGEKVGLRRWTAILIGFVGVLIVLRPSSETFSGGAPIAIFGSFAFALMMLTTRSLRGTPDAVLVFWQTASALLAGLVLSFFAWTPLTVAGFLSLSILGVVAMAAHLCIARAFKLADAATIAPLQYTMLPWATLFGFMFFDEIPQWTTLLGATVIIGSGLYIFFRERQLLRRGPTIAKAALPPGG